MSGEDVLALSVPSSAHDDETRTTIAEPSSLASVALAAGGSSISHAVLHTPAAAAVLGEEVQRARGWSVACAILCGTAVSFTPWLEGSAAMRAVFAVSLTSLMLLSLWTRWRIREEHHYTPAVYLVFGIGQATCSFGIQYYLGVFSATACAVNLGLSFLAFSLFRGPALLVCAYAIAGWVVMAVGMTTGMIADRGLYYAGNVPIVGRVFMVVMVPMVYSLTVWIARVSRRAMLDAIERSHRALRLAEDRAQQLDEAREDLEQALRAGAGMSGRHSGAMAGQYRLGEIVGRGAMGEIYAARDAETDATVAVKTLRPAALEREAAVQRFLREGELAGRLRSPHVVSIYGVGRMAEGVPYIAMELLSGDNLATILRDRNRLPVAEVTELVRHVARGLEAAHAAGIVHRDLKPHNIFHCREPGARTGVWKILDFGVSKLQDSSGTLTQQNVVGTPGYMSPEQARGIATDARGDVFSLGAVAYRALTGRRPFVGDDTPQMLYAIVYANPPRPSSLVDDTPRDLDHVLAMALAKEPASRFRTAAELAAAFAAAAHGQLPAALRQRAEALTRAHPWNSERR